MKNISNFNNFQDINILEKYVSNKITEEQFSNHFDFLNEKMSMSGVIEKIKNIFNWVINNIKKVGMKIKSIVENVVKIAKRFLSPTALRLVFLICIMMLTQASIANISGGEDGDKNKTELVVTTRQIEGSKGLINTAIGFLSQMKETENTSNVEITQALGTLISIRDSLSPNDLNADTYKYMADESKELIESVVAFIDAEVKKILNNKDADNNADINLYLYYNDIAKKLTAHIDYGMNFKYVKVVGDNSVRKWSASKW